MKTKRMELRGRIGACTKAHNKKLQRANELMASLTEQMKKHEVKLASWVKRLTDCKTAKSLDVKCRLKLDLDCDRLQDHFKAVMEQIETSPEPERKRQNWRFGS